MHGLMSRKARQNSQFETEKTLSVTEWNCKYYFLTEPLRSLRVTH